MRSKANCQRQLYDSDLFIEEVGSKDEMFPIDEENIAICFSDAGSRTDYCVLAVNVLADLHLGSAVDVYHQVPLYRYEEGHRKTENITEWAFAQFRKQYHGKERRHRTITKRAIFNYVHLSLDKDCPDPRPVTPATSGRVVAFPQVNGLHHRYERLAA